MQTIKLGTRQAEMLRKIVKTNGGGTYPVTAPDQKLVMRLHALGLVQGKKGQDWQVVHTPDGLSWVRHNAHFDAKD